MTMDVQQQPLDSRSIEGYVKLHERTELPGRIDGDNKSAPTHWPDKRDWEQNKAIISELYKSKGLKGMMKTMEQEHAFKATYVS